jgi:hypothetical protein
MIPALDSLCERNGTFPGEIGPAVYVQGMDALRKSFLGAMTEKDAEFALSKGVKNLVRVTVDSDGDQGSKTGIVTATDAHPFWAPTARQWEQAGTLRPGQWLQTSQGTYLKIATIEKSTATDQRVYNLTVADLHTYYVLAGKTPVLVHNSNCNSLTRAQADECCGLLGIHEDQAEIRRRSRNLGK